MTGSGANTRGARNPDAALRYVVGVLVIGVAINVLSAQFAGDTRLVIGSTVVLSVVAAAMVPGGLLRREREGSARWLRLLALLLLGAYPVVSWVVVSHVKGSFVTMFVPVATMWAAVTLLCWQSLRSRVGFTDAGRGVAFLLAGFAFLLYAVAFVRISDTQYGIVFLLAGVASVLAGSASLRSRGNTLVGVAQLVFAIAFLLAGVALLRGGDALAGVWVFTVGISATMVGAASLLDSVGFLRRRGVTIGVACLLGGVASPLMGVAFLRGGAALDGVACLPVGVAWLLWAAQDARLHGVAFLLIAVACLLLGVAFLRGGDALAGVSVLMVAIAATVVGIEIFLAAQNGHHPTVGRLVGWLRQK